jgi:DNA-binding transcriptional ArsR family regulator
MAMLRRLGDEEARVLRMKLALDYFRIISAVVFEVDDFGSILDEIAVCLAVYIGTVEGRPMTYSKLAGYVGMPRSTVVRKVRTLRIRGLIECDDPPKARLGPWQREKVFRATTLYVERLKAAVLRM